MKLKQSSGINYLLNKDVRGHNTILDTAMRKDLVSKKNEIEAVKWYKLAAEQGICDGTTQAWDVAIIKVLRVPIKNDDEAVKWTH